MPNPSPKALLDAQQALQGLTVESAMPIAAPGAAPSTLVLDSELTPGDRIASMLRGAESDSVTVRLYRRNPSTAKLAWCVNYTGAAFLSGDLEMIRREWGAGEYEIRVYGSKGVIAREEITIEAQSGSAPESNGSNELLKQLIEQNNRMLERLSNPAPAPDPNAALSQAFTLMREMREAMGANQPPQVSAPNTSQLLTELVGAMKTLKGVSEEFAPQKSDPDNPLSMLGPVMDTIKTVVSMNGNRPPQMSFPVSVPASIAENPAPEVSGAENPQPIENQPNMIAQLVIKGLFDKLINYAESKAPIDEAAQFVFEKLPDEFVQYLDLPNWFDILSALDARIIPHRAWMEQVKAKADILFNEPEDPGA